ncbi:hypothetical protein QLQ86_17980 [Halomonas sp. LR5S13]|nr:hypothetical protein [Halomonas rhizosphaerae]MDI5922667.1 hypothetical protein [Halomonas rhizosphaerae]
MGLEANWMLMVMGLMLAYAITIFVGLVVKRTRDGRMTPPE